MAILRSCCCFFSVRKGSFVCGVYTLIFYTMLVVTGIFHANSVLHTPVGFTLVLLLLIFSGLCVIFSVVLLLGLFLDNRLLLIPWLTVVSMTTLLDVALSLYFVTDLRVNPFVIAMYVVDYTLCSINIYAILCVLSQYQEYAVGRRAMGQKNRAALPVLSGYSSRGERSKISSVATWPGRMQPQSKHVSQTSTSMVTHSTVPNGDTAAGTGSKLSPHRGLLEATSAFAAGPEELSSGLHISTAETSLQPSGDDTDVQENSCVLDVSKAEDGNTESRTFVADARSARGTMANHEADRALVVPVPETRPLLEVTCAAYTGGREDGQEDHV
ncbi:uncharacterized protein LOC119169234 [Rhipicephalus microplus]|uniref:uncharacterized protein LOC119169234 n=1 Tax=Rhipicephalus microplus TaxID=6941 RepID=UPI003F6AE8B0